MTTRIWLIRHGETTWNVSRRFTGWTDVPLTPAGREQACRLGEELAGRGFDRVWSSDLSRAVETARLAVGEPTVDRRLREIDFGHLEGRRWDELDAGTQAALKDFDRFAAPGGETMAAFRARVAGFLDELAPGDHAVITHGGVVRLVGRDCGVEGFPANAAILVVDWPARRVLEADPPDVR